MNLKYIAKSVLNWCKANPQIFITGLGVASAIATSITSGKCHVKAVKADELNPSDNLLDFAKRNWKCYVPAAISLGVTIFAFGALHGATDKKYQALAAAYSVSQLDLSNLREKMAEQVKVLKEGATEKDKEVATKKLPDSTMVIFGDEQVLCVDAITGRRFRSTPELLRKYCNNISEDLLNYGACPLNDFYSQINLSPVDVGDELGWEGGKTIEPQFMPVITDSGSPAIKVAIKPAPQPNWFKIG
ncbi:MAG: hypothetical protein HXO60_07045 [Rothia mucilaginosa]|uniref:DUF6353 family protein n=1 Tax=Rothia mucilaginosa TaxID=43675 RepID=UPI001CAEA658|nr:DUF6353 family protein [Rothia mucilaginosa]MBF1652240.1 hypothetical protein [Rothia mucilaginosa]